MKVNSDVIEDFQLLSNNIDIYKFGIFVLLLFFFFNVIFSAQVQIFFYCSIL